MPIRNSILLSSATPAFCRGHAALDFHRATHGLHHAGELYKHAVASGLDNAAAMRGDLRIEERLPTPLQVGKRTLLVAAHQTAVAGDIRRQHGRQPPLHALAVQKTLPGSVIPAQHIGLDWLTEQFLKSE
jgi:hypothetical protein